MIGGVRGRALETFSSTNGILISWFLLIIEIKIKISLEPTIFQYPEPYQNVLFGTKTEESLITSKH